MGKAGEVTDLNFDQEVIQSSVPVLVDFWAPWCGPCKSIAPIIDELAEQYTGKFKIVKLNVDDNPQIANRFNISGIPNLIFFKNGAVKDQLRGSRPRQDIVGVIEKVLLA